MTTSDKSVNTVVIGDSCIHVHAYNVSPKSLIMYNKIVTVPVIRLKSCGFSRAGQMNLRKRNPL